MKYLSQGTDKSPIAVIFDNDGVLVDSEPISLLAYQRGIEEQGLKLTEADLERNCGLTDADIVSDLEKVYGASLDQELFSRRKAELYKALAEERGLKAFPGARRLLEELRAEGIPYAIASSGSREKIGYNLQKAGLTDLVSVILSGEEFRRGKPDPEIFVKAAAKLGYEPERCVVIEDSLNGLRAARAAGAFALAVATTFAADKVAPLADAVFGSVEDIAVTDLTGLGLSAQR